MAVDIDPQSNLSQALMTENEYRAFMEHGGLSIRVSASGGNSKPRVRQSALTIVEALGIDDEEKRNILLILAQKFEKNAFMPNVNSIRAFLAQQGDEISHVKSRQQGMSTVFKCLAGWETQKLCEMHMKGSYGGPKSLAVIAESIEKAGQRNRL